MSDHNHASSVQGNNKNIEDDYGWKEEARLLRTKIEKHRENTNRKMDEMREMFGQLVLNQNMGKRHEEERHRCRRHPDFDEQSEKEILYQLHGVQQTDKVAEEYRQKMELLMFRVGIREEPRKTIDRFKSGLNLEIQDRVELFPFNYFKMK